MTDKTKTALALVMDRSGSMSGIAGDMEVAIGKLLRDQDIPGMSCDVSLYRFDDEYEVVFENRPIKDVPPIKLEPRNSTALYDALGRTIDRLGRHLASLPESSRPGAVVIIVITDGMENASKEYTQDRVRKMIQTQERDYAWRFVYLGSEAAGVLEGAQLGMQVAQYTASSHGTKGMGQHVNSALRNYRSAVVSSVESGMMPQSLDLDSDLTTNE